MKRCDFCNKTEEEVDFLIDSGSNTYICDDCILLSAAILLKEEKFKNKLTNIVKNAIKKLNTFNLIMGA